MGEETSNEESANRERDLPQCLEQGVVKSTQKRFEDILTVPQELQDRIFYWPEEKAFCAHVSSIGKALDSLTEIHTTFQGQFRVLGNLRASFIQAPTEYFVAPMYFCDRALDSLLQHMVKAQTAIAKLFRDLEGVESESAWRYRETKKAFLENKFPKKVGSDQECISLPDMEIKEQRVELLGELTRRIASVRKGGSSMFTFRKAAWLRRYFTTHVEAIGPQNGDGGASRGREERREHVEDRSNSGSRTIEHKNSSEPPATPKQNFSNPSRSQQLTQGKPMEIPETPEVMRTGSAPRTQRSSPRKRKRSQSSARTDDTDNSKQVEFVARTLIQPNDREVQTSSARGSGDSVEAMRAATQSGTISSSDRALSRHEQENAQNRAEGPTSDARPTSGAMPASNACPVPVPPEPSCRQKRVTGENVESGQELQPEPHHRDDERSKSMSA